MHNKQDPSLEKLKARLGGEIRPVRPLSRSWKRALWMIPVWVGLAILTIQDFGLRGDHVVLGTALTWGLPLIQIAGAYLLMWIGLRNVIPARWTPVRTLLLAAAVTVGLHLATSLITYWISPRPGGIGFGCFRMISIYGLCILLPAILLASRGLPRHWSLTALACGLAAGLTGEAAWRIHCSLSSPFHVYLSHTTSILVAVLVAVLISYGIHRIQLFRMARRLSAERKES